MKIMILPAIAILAGCATVADVRAKPASLTRATTKSASEFQGCFSTAMEGESYRPIWTPKSGGGTFTYSIGSTVVWVMDVRDVGKTRSISVHGGGSDFAKNDQETTHKIESCL